MRFRLPASRTALLVIGGLIPVFLLGAAGLTYVRAQQPPPKPDKTPSVKKYKNIKVLKDLPADQLIPVMHKIDDSLGVKCDFCHVIKPDHTGFELDDKPTKNVARSMITMTNDINKHQKILNNKATCFLCHHGKPEPENLPPTAGPGPGQPR